jgi:hypothetical protein
VLPGEFRPYRSKLRVTNALAADEDGAAAYLHHRRSAPSDGVAEAPLQLRMCVRRSDGALACLATPQNERGPGDVVAYGLRMPEGVHEALALWRSHPERAPHFWGRDECDRFFAVSLQDRSAASAIFWVVVLPMCGDEDMLRWCEVHLSLSWPPPYGCHPGLEGGAAVCGGAHAALATPHAPTAALAAARARRDVERPA